MFSFCLKLSTKVSFRPSDHQWFSILISDPSLSPSETSQPQALNLDQQLKQKRGNKTRETYQPRIAELGSVLKLTNDDISALELNLANLYSYHAGLLKKPVNIKHHLFSGHQRRAELGREILEKKKQLDNIARNQKVAEYHRVLEKLVELKVQFLDIVKTELFELNSACCNLL